MKWGNNLQNSDQGSGESYGRIRAWGWWYPGFPNARDPGHPQLNKIPYETRATRQIEYDVPWWKHGQTTELVRVSR